VPFAYCLLAVLAAGCASGHHSVLATDSANNTTLHVEQGSTVAVELHSSYWTIKGSSNPRVLREVGQPELMSAPHGANCLPGMGCRPVEEMFTAELPGTAVVTASRTTCGEAMLCAPSQRDYKLTVVVTR
jgi:hypothetical protein